MLRVVFEVLLPLLLPTILYFGAVRIMALSKRSAAARPVPVPWLWLAGAGVLLLAAMLVIVNVGFGTADRGGVYVPPRWVDGHLVPGHFEPAPAAPDAKR